MFHGDCFNHLSVSTAAVSKITIWRIRLSVNNPALEILCVVSRGHQINACQLAVRGCTSIHTEFTRLEHFKYQPKKMHNFSSVSMCLYLRCLTCCISCRDVDRGSKSCSKLLAAQKILQNCKSCRAQSNSGLSLVPSIFQIGFSKQSNNYLG